VVGIHHLPAKEGDSLGPQRPQERWERVPGASPRAPLWGALGEAPKLQAPRSRHNHAQTPRPQAHASASFRNADRRGIKMATLFRPEETVARPEAARKIARLTALYWAAEETGDRKKWRRYWRTRKRLVARYGAVDDLR
jgi:hypothetical protein